MSNSLNKYALLFFLIITSIFVEGFSRIVISKNNNTWGKSIQVISNNKSSLTFEVRLSEYSVRTKTLEGKVFQYIDIPDFFQTATPGKPQLPVKGLLFGLPENAQVKIDILKSQFKLLPIKNLYFTPKIIIDQPTENNSNFVVNYEPFFDLTYEESKNYYPEMIVKGETAGYLRYQKVGQVQIYPIQYNHSENKIRLYTFIKLKVTFTGQNQSPDGYQEIKTNNDPFDKILRRSLINYETAKKWRNKNQVMSQPFPETNQQNQYMQNIRYKIIVNEDWIYRITKDDLEQAGLNTADIDPNKIQIFNRGEEIPIYVFGEEDSTFNESDYIIFYGTKPHTKYTNENVYWLTIGNNFGLRMREKKGNVHGDYPIVTRSVYKKHFEENHIYFPGIPDGENQDHWFWQKMGAPISIDINFFLNDVVQISALPCSLIIEYRGNTYTAINPDHHTILSVNGKQLLDDLWDGQIKFNNQANFNQGILKEGINTINILLPGDTGSIVDNVYLNWFEVYYWRNYIANNDFFLFRGREEFGTYQFEIKHFTSEKVHIFDITDSANVQRVTDFQTEPVGDQFKLRFQDEAQNRLYFTMTEDQLRTPHSLISDNPSDLRLKNNQADYIMITPEEFADELVQLAHFRNSQGLNVKIVKVGDIYDEFNHGIKNPKAIRDFLSYTFHNWRKPAPTYVLLVGDASYDYKDYLSSGYPDLMPTHLFTKPISNFESSSDNWFACVAGEDILPDMLIGRIPVRTIQHLKNMIDKILLYEMDPDESDWNKNILFIADNEDDAGQFENVSDHFVDNYIPENYNPRKIYLRDYNIPSQIRESIVNEINNGCLILNYIGHGSIRRWAHENIFLEEDFYGIVNRKKLFIGISMSCDNGFFHHPTIPYCMPEKFINQVYTGAIAFFAPSGPQYTIADQYLGDGFFSALFNESDNLLGSVVTKAKLSVFSAGQSYYDHVEFFNLLGDPALKINLPTEEITVNEGWNLISLPRQPSNTSVDSVLSSLDGSWTKLLAYSNDTWIGADDEIPSSFWSLSKMEVGKGYWLQTTSEGTFKSDGVEKNRSIFLHEGWNLIGYPLPFKTDLTDAFISINGNWKKCLYYANGNWFGADASLPTTYWTLKNFRAGAGYWLEMDKADTLHFVRIPERNNSPDPLNEKALSGFNPTSETTPPPIQQTFNKTALEINKQFKLTIPMPSGYFGTIKIRGEPAPVGSKLSAWINDVQYEPQIKIEQPGKYSLLLINGDDPETPEIEGGKQGDIVIFKIETPSGETVTAETNGIWEEGVNHRLNLTALSVPNTLNYTLFYEFRVDNRLVGVDILDGDPISPNSNISVTIKGDISEIANENINLYIDDELVEKTAYTFIPIKNQQDIKGKIIFQPAFLQDGYHELKIEIPDINLSSESKSANFKFLISSKLSFDKVVNFPNPMVDDTKFTYYLLNDKSTKIEIKIYTVSGRLINEIQHASNDIGYNETYWNGRDEFGNRIANGVYFYKITANDGEEKVEVIEKLVMMK